jgi:hypothetical protein
VKTCDVFLSEFDFSPQHNGLQFLPFSCKWHNFNLLYGWLIFHFVYASHFLSPVVGHLGWFHSLVINMSVLVDDMYFCTAFELRTLSKASTLPLEPYPLHWILTYIPLAMPKSGLEGSYAGSIFIFLRNFHIDFPQWLH